ncbi:hypothetical protein HYU12_00305, partial [Candidatus Woesearchaeota archaeon]|nr:hypothetical protein [Candidatus Woesearchaeota archaeon]
GLGGNVSGGLFQIDNTGAVITLTNPTPGTVINGTVNVTFTGGVRKPQLRIDGGSLVNADTNNSYLWDTTTVLDGAHTIVVNDSDAQGNTITSPVYAFTIDNTPGYVTIIQPAADLVFVAGSVTVEAIASDDVKYVVFNISNSTAANRTYNITVRAYNVNNSLIDVDVRSVRFDNLAPSAPVLTALPAFDTDGTVVLNWSDVGGDVSYYNLYRSTTSGFNISFGTLVKNVSVNLTTDTPGVNAHYYYRVTAVDSAGHGSVESNEINTVVQVGGAGGTTLIGTLKANDSYVKDGDNVMFTFEGVSTGLNVTIEAAELRRIDNSTLTVLRLNDSGVSPDLVSDDGLYTGGYAINSLNNASDGNYIISGVVNDSAGNVFTPKVNITLDNTAPNASISINGGDAFAGSRTVGLSISFNDTLSGMQDCRLANENQIFGVWNECASNIVWTLSSGDGLKTVIIEARDRAGNVNTTNDTITLQTIRATTIIQPLNGSAVKGQQQIIAIAPDDAAIVTFRISNGTGNFMANGSAGETNDTTPENGFITLWNTTAFADSLYNITAISYTANSVHISNASILFIEVDNMASAAPLLTALPALDTDGTVVLNWSDVGGDVSYYNIYRSTTTGFNISSGTLVKNLSTNFTTDAPGVDATYYYKITAVDNVGHESAESNHATTTLKAAVDIFGTLEANDTIVNDGSGILFTFKANMLRLNVTINQTHMRVLDNYSGDLTLNDSGINGDITPNDATYSAIYTINKSNNASDGVKQLTAIVNDSAGNKFLTSINITLDNTAPNASIEIFGTSVAGFVNVSTEYTTSRAVTLITTFNDTIGIEQCRYANENRAFSDWEKCTPNRAWLLSPTAGNKTVIIEAMDNAGNINSTNDTITFNATGAGLDVTPPLTPTVIDDGTYTNSDVRLHAAWNTTDAESELLNAPLEYEYRIRFNGTSDTSITGYLNSTFTYIGTATEVSVQRLNLTDGNNYTFEVRAINTAAVRSATGTSDGIIVDISPPTAPSINSTHLQGNWSSDNNARFNWTATDSISNVSAYSYVLDTNSTTTPDTIPEAETEHTQLTTSSNDGQSSVLKFNQSGNASTVYVEVRSAVAAGDVLRITMQLAESHAETPEQMGIRAYATNILPTGFNMTGNNISEVVDFTRDITHPTDIKDSTSHTADIQINTAATSFYIAIAGSTTDNDNSYNLLIAQSNTSYDTTRQKYYCQQGASCTNTTNTTGYAIKAEQRDLKTDEIWDRTYSVGDGTFYFHARAVDKAGNFGSASHYQILVDRSSPSTPQMNQPIQTAVNVTQLTFNWTQSTDPESGVDNYTLAVDNNSDFSSPEFYAWIGNLTNYTVTGLTADATYYARAHSRNKAGVNSSWSDSVTTEIDTTAPLITLSKPAGTVKTGDVTVVLKTNEKATCSGRQGSNAYADFTFTNSTIHETKATITGTSFDVKCTDTVNNQRTQTLSITVDTSASVSSIALQSPSVFTDELVNTNATVTTSSGTGLGELGKEAFTVKIDGKPQPFSIFDTGGGNYTLQFASPSINGSYLYEVTAGGVTGTSRLKVVNLLLVVQYVDASIAGNKGSKMIYAVKGNYSIGFASDSRTVTTASTADAFNISANAQDGEVFLFVTRSSGNVERAENLLKDRVFLDKVNPSFGYQLDEETFIVFTDLEYSEIALTGNRTIKAGRYNLILENKGFDSTLNKTRIDVRVS